MPTRRSRPPTPSRSAPGHRPVPHRAHVLRRRPHRRHARDDPGRQHWQTGKKALAKLLPYQKEDFVGIFKELKGFPATIRFLDPPLHEFLPARPRGAERSGGEDGRPVEKITQRVKELHEFNPDARLPRLPPWASSIRKSPKCRPAPSSKRPPKCRKQGIKVKPEIMIPLVGFKKELDLQVEVVHRVAKEVMAEKKVKLNYLVGTMIEVPRGALTADEIAQTAAVLQLRHQRPDPDLPWA